jgi:hypothetical protein
MGIADTVNLVQTYGASPGYQMIIATPALVNTGDEPPIDPYIDYLMVPIVPGTNSFELFLRAQFMDPSAAITSIKLFLDTYVFPANVTLKFKGSWSSSAYTTPVKTTSSIATADVPVASPAGINVSVGNTTTYSKTETFFTDYLVFQLQTTMTAAQVATTIPVKLVYILGGVPTTKTFNILASTQKNPAIVSYYEILGIFKDTVDVTGTLNEDGIV